MTAVDDAWQAALASEHQAVFGYSLLGPHLGGADLTRAVDCSDAHESLRNRTADALTAAGLDPVQSHADYPSLYPVRSAGAARALAVRLEDDCAAAWRYLYAVAAGETGTPATGLRREAQAALSASAVRAVRWRVASGAARPTRPFPGVAG